MSSIIFIKIRGEQLPEDILPPAPPGEARSDSKDKKKGLFGGLFKKKEKASVESIAEVDAGIPPETVPQGAQPAETPAKKPDLLDRLIPEQIKKDMEEMSGQEQEVAEPGKIEKKFELPDIDEPYGFEEELAEEKPEISEKVPETAPIAEPPKIKPTKAQPVVKQKKVKEKKKPKLVKKKVKLAKKPVLKKDDKSTWIISEARKQADKEDSEFTSDIKSDVDKIERPINNEFTKDLHPDEVKQFAKDLERKKFEQKKGIQYEPDVSLEPGTPTGLQQPGRVGVDDKDMLLEESPEEELDAIRKRLRRSFIQKPKQSRKIPKTKEKEPEPIKQEPISMPKVKAKAQEPLPKPEGMPEEPPVAAEEKKRSVAQLIKNVEKELKDNLKEEQKTRIHKEYEKKRKELEKEKEKIDKHMEKLEQQKQALEQEKIVVAGKADKYEFKEKQLAKEKKDLEKEKQHFEKTKQEADELVQKLPILRQDYDTLDKNMKEMYRKLKQNEKLSSEIKEKEDALKKAQKRLEQTEERLKEQGFADYLESELEPGSFVSPKFEEKDILQTTHLELYNLVDECKSLVRANNIVEAKNSYMELRNAYKELKLKGAEKDMLYTAIRELYDDIKLAEIESPEEESLSNAPDTIPDTIL